MKPTVYFRLWRNIKVFVNTTQIVSFCEFLLLIFLFDMRISELNQTCGNNKVHRPTFTQNRINEPNKTISKEKYNPSKILSMSSTTLPEKQSQGRIKKNF